MSLLESLPRFAPKGFGFSSTVRGFIRRFLRVGKGTWHRRFVTLWIWRIRLTALKFTRALRAFCRYFWTNLRKNLKAPKTGFFKGVDDFALMRF
jgi:hypothetical protein